MHERRAVSSKTQEVAGFTSTREDMGRKSYVGDLREDGFEELGVAVNIFTSPLSLERGVSAYRHER